MMWCGISSTSLTTLYPEKSVKVNFFGANRKNATVHLLFHQVTLFVDLSITPIPSSLIHCICSSIYFSPSPHSLIPLCIYLFLRPSFALFINLALSHSLSLSLYLSIHQYMYFYIFLPPFIHLYKIKTQNVEEEERRRRCETGRLRLIISHSCCIGFKFLYIGDDVEVREVFKKERNCGGQG